MTTEAKTRTSNTDTKAEDWTQHGKWGVRLDNECFRIFPKGRDGKSIPVTIRRSFIHLRIPTLTGGWGELTFKYYLHMKRKFWADDRQKGSCTRHHVRHELARLLFQGDQSAAADLMAQAEARL